MHFSHQIQQKNLILKQEDNNILEEYVTKFIEAKSELREVRQRLRKLADKTIKETRGLEFLIRSLDEYEDSLILKFALEKMSRLLDTSEKTLIEAKEKYNMAFITFLDLNSSIQNQNRFISKIVNEESESNKENIRAVQLGAGAGVGVTAAICIPFDFFVTFGACSLINVINGAIVGGAAASAEVTLNKKQATLLKFQNLTRNIDGAILTATNGLSEEIAVLEHWHNNVDNVASNIDNYTEEYLRKYKSIRDLFILTLSDLRQSAEEFLSFGKLFEENIDIENLQEKSDIENVLLSKELPTK